MARKTLDRRRLRDAAAAAASAEEVVAAEAGADGEDEDGEAKPAKKPVRAKKAPAVRKPRAKKPPPTRFARWGVFDGTMKQVASFGYDQRPAADAKLADLIANRKGLFFLQLVKEPAAAEPAAAPAE